MAQRHPGSRRKRDSSESGEDVFLAHTIRFTEWSRRNTGLLTAMVVVLALVVWGAVYYADFREERTAEATIQLERIRQTAGMGDLEGAKQELGIFLQRFEGTRAADEARLVLGQVHLETGAVPQAISTLEEAFGELDREPLSIQGAFLLAGAYEEAARWDAAEETYLEIAERAPMRFQERKALADAARIRARRGDHAAAADLYRRILEGISDDDPDRGLYELRLGEVETAASG